MKKCITLIVLMLLAFQNADSLWIIGDFYINQDYIAQNVCINRFDAVPICNGKCYLEQKLKANDREEQKFPTVTYREVQLFLQNQIPFSFTVVFFSLKKEYPMLRAYNQRYSYIFSIYHPPRWC
ncbi:hypothetical protein [Flavobacterium salmonis]|uniref:Uncharacterized protein n=1 Tax=Flavobacterium salmonis TaxID=2654844 RepID=A0A6V6Z600_9FLAO|nr:hypothetical protein [Flavobacterium salmonis]CAD0007211.1 hypothetical protein FLAT13_03706 [Flavobacterium salmonis]